MFNRALEVKVVKKDKDAASTIDEDAQDFGDKAAIISNAVNRTLAQLTVGVVAYVTLDTVRQMLVARASK